MIINRIAIGFIALGLCAQDIAAQQSSSCPTGPGAEFGVIAYQCASCSFKLEQQPLYARGSEPIIYIDGVRVDSSRVRLRERADSAPRFYRAARYRPIFGFQAEPIVLETTSNSPLKPGDVIEAVNTLPITTRAGSDLFTYPPSGEFVIRVRRAGTRMDVTARVTSPCMSLPRADTTRSTPYGRGGERGAGPGLQDRIRIRDMRLDELQTTVDRRFGFGVSCQPSCTRTRAADGSEYYKFEGYPPIVAVLKDGVAEEVGLRKGDQIIEIDGHSILSEEGALRFSRSAQRESLHVTVLRNGQRIGYSLRVR